jgi:hypothetical protein
MTDFERHALAFRIIRRPSGAGHEIPPIRTGAIKPERQWVVALYRLAIVQAMRWGFEYAFTLPSYRHALFSFYLFYTYQESSIVMM